MFFIFDWSVWSSFHCATSPAYTSIIPSYNSWVVFSFFFFVSLTLGCEINGDSFIGLFLPCSSCELFFRYDSHHSYLSFSLCLSVSVTLSARVPPRWACHNLLTSPDFIVFAKQSLHFQLHYNARERYLRPFSYNAIFIAVPKVRKSWLKHAKILV